MEKFITVTGAKTHNLKNIEVVFPRQKISAIVGVSGAGKTSLAFDTIYAEGYLRYIESISPYIRQFLDKLEKPPVEKITGLPPAIAFKHKKPAKNPRSIVATALDIYDYLRLLYAKIAQCFCPGCGQEIKPYSLDEIIPELLAQETEKVDICFPYQGDVAFLVNRGYYFYLEPATGTRQRVDHQIKDKVIHVLIDSIEPTPENTGRLFEALDKSMTLGNGSALIYHVDASLGQKRSRVFSASLYCATCQITYPPPDEHLFSFNSPKGACSLCKGFGDSQVLDPQVIFQPGLSLAKGGLRPFNSPATRKYGQVILEHAQKLGIDLHKPVAELSQMERDFLLNGQGTFTGIRGFFDWLKSKSYKVQARVFISRYTTYQPCPACHGSRLNEYASAFRVRGITITQFLQFTLQEAAEFMRLLQPSHFQDKISPEVFTDIQARLDFLVQSGLAYIPLNRPTYTLSRGEYQRIQLAFILGSTLSDSLLILDQPSSDLHPHDYHKLKVFLDRLKENGNTILMIEHNADTVRNSDYVVELGPAAGEKGGQVVFQGSVPGFFNASSSALTLTARYFLQPIALQSPQNPFKTWLRFPAATTFNLKGFTYQVPRCAFTVVVGVSGAGKTTLLYHEMYRKGKLQKSLKEVIFIDPGWQQMSGQVIVAAFFALFAPLREVFANLKESRVLQYTASHFSFNSVHGQCDECRGKGYHDIAMQFLPTVKVNCTTCGGSGYKADILKVRYHDKNIREMLDLSIDAFIPLVSEVWPAPKKEILYTLQENGLGYIRLGQPLKTLSVGERQRLKLIKHLDTQTSQALFLIDEPSFGMHPHDVQMIKNLIHKLIANKNTVVAAEHNLHLIACADYILELGPGGGETGGYLIYQGPTATLVNSPESITGIYLKNSAKSS